jgi:hypothetical protein
MEAYASGNGGFSAARLPCGSCIPPGAAADGCACKPSAPDCCRWPCGAGRQAAPATSARDSGMMIVPDPSTACRRVSKQTGRPRWDQVPALHARLGGSRKLFQPGFENRDADMRVLLGIGLAAFVASDALAEDRYQVAPMRSWTVAGERQHPDHNTAVRIDLRDGSGLWCHVQFGMRDDGIQLRQGRCSPINFNGPKPPAGPVAAVVPPNAPATGTVRPLRYPALWKADQTTGAVSFCTASPSWNPLGAPPTQWHCVKLDGS